MKKTEQQQLDSLVRTRDFIRTRANTLQGISSLPQVKQLNDAIDAVLGHGNTQGTSDRIVAARISRQRALAKQLVRSHMIPITKFARASLRGTPNFAALTRSGIPDTPRRCCATPGRWRRPRGRTPTNS